MTPTIPTGFVTITQAARILGRSYQTTRDWMLAGKCGPTRLIDGRTLIVQESRVQDLKKQPVPTRE